MTSRAKSEGRFGKQDFVYLSDEDVYRCPASEKLSYRYTNEEKLRRYWTNACSHCTLKDRCTTGKERRITRWEHENVVEAMHGNEKSDPNIVAVKPANKAARSATSAGLLLVADAIRACLSRPCPRSDPGTACTPAH